MLLTRLLAPQRLLRVNVASNRQLAATVGLSYPSLRRFSSSELSGVPTRIIYHDNTSGFSAFVLKTFVAADSTSPPPPPPPPLASEVAKEEEKKKKKKKKKKAPTTPSVVCAGQMPFRPSLGSPLSLTGVYKTHPKFGKQFQIHDVVHVTQLDEHGEPIAYDDAKGTHNERRSIGEKEGEEEEKVVKVKKSKDEAEVEEDVASELQRWLTPDLKALLTVTAEDITEWFEEDAIALSVQQRAAMRNAGLEPISIVTGGPGTGKTQTVKAIVDMWKEHMGFTKILLLSPTGRGAMKLSQLAMHPAQTIHRALEYSMDTRAFRRHRRRKLDCEAVVIDESSMVDIHLAYSLLSALPTSCHVIFMGDVEQIPSIGPGNVLADLIRSGVLPVTRLTKIFRQASESGIIQASQSIQQGEMPFLPLIDPACEDEEPEQDLLFIELNDEVSLAEALDYVIKRVASLHQETIDVKSDMQVLSPTRQESDRINHLLKENLFFGTAEANPGARLCVGDRVMHGVNNYQKEVFNGNIGTVQSISRTGKVLVRLEDQRVIKYTKEEAERELSLAWCVTIHKSQGSEFELVVLVVRSDNARMLTRKLLYTAVTRARQVCVLIGDLEAIHQAIHNQGDTRETNLAELLINPPTTKKKKKKKKKKKTEEEEEEEGKVTEGVVEKEEFMDASSLFSTLLKK